MKYFIGSLLGINVVLIWWLGIVLTDHEVSIRHIKSEQAMVQAQLYICSEEIGKSVEEIMEKFKEAYGGT
jgi:hypothetical protein